MKELLYIVWNPDLMLFQVGNVGVRWYSTCWLIGLLLAYLIVRSLYKQQKLKDELFEPLFLYCFCGILLGARLGHCIFYQPDYFLTSAIGFTEMFIPIKFLGEGSVVDLLVHGQWKFIGYEGLASHGGTLGLMIALWLYCKHTGIRLWHVLDNIAIATPVTACFIRLGNLMNSEIIGKVTDVPWAFIFERVDTYPRHPGQLYEAIAYACLLVIGWCLYKKMPHKVGTGFFFGLCLLYIFTFRFCIEWTKEDQEAFEAGMLFNMGQLLSVPFILLGGWCMWRSKKLEKK